MRNRAHHLGGCIFPVPEEIVYSFFNFLFDILEYQFKFCLYITAWKREFGLLLYFYLSKRVSLCSRYGLFAIPSIILSHLQLSKIDLPKLNSSFLMEIVTIPVVLVDEFYFNMHHLIKAWIFEKIIFELLCIFL